MSQSDIEKFLTATIHEIGAHVTTIIALLDQANENHLTKVEMFEQQYPRIKTAAQRALKLVQVGIDLSRTQPRPLQLVECDPVNLFRSFVQTLIGEGVIETTDIQLEGFDNLPLISADECLLKKALTDWIRYFCGRRIHGGAVTFTAAVEDPWLAIRISPSDPLISDPHNVPAAPRVRDSAIDQQYLYEFTRYSNAVDVRCEGRGGPLQMFAFCDVVTKDHRGTVSWEESTHKRMVLRMRYH